MHPTILHAIHSNNINIRASTSHPTIHPNAQQETTKILNIENDLIRGGSLGIETKEIKIKRLLHGIDGRNLENFFRYFR